MSFSEPASEAPQPAPAAKRRGRGPLVPTLIALMIAGSLLGAVVNTWTEALWFGQAGYFEVFRTRIVTQVVLFALGAALMAGIVFLNMWLAYRNRPIYAPVGVEQSGLERYRQALEPLRRVVAVLIPAGLGLFAGSAFAAQWMPMQMFMNRSAFRDAEGAGTGVDPQWGLDVGFYVFALPVFRFFLGFGFAVIVLSLLIAAAVHYIYGGVRVSGPGPRTTRTARIQLSVLLGVLLLIRAAGYWLDRYSVLTSSSHLFTGAGYTDINAVIPAKAILAGIALLVAGLFVATAFTGGWRLPVVGVALMVVSSIVVGGLYPAAIQRFQVAPSERDMEEPYLQRNIDATRAAYGINGSEVSPYEPTVDASAGALRQDAETTASIRLLDPAIVSPAFSQLERNKQYYSFAEPLDIDRYTIDGEKRDAVVAVRELNLDGLPEDQRSWVKDHTVFTHGFGMVAAYGNQRAPGGSPSFFEGGIPPVGKIGDYEPRIYFGEQSPDFSIVGGPADGPKRELDFPTDDTESGQANTTFAGDGGPSIGNWVNRLLYAIKFRDQNIMLSDSVTSESQILYDRNPRERVRKVAPWLTLDGDPYPAVVGDRIKWIVDGYTVTSAYPYSDQQQLGDLTRDQISASSNSVVALQQRPVNYIRNSVKATVDAYDGKVDLYAWDENDPLLAAWRKVFPNTVKPLSEVSSELMGHLRYPEDLFKVQRTILSRYHVQSATSFYDGQDFWQVPNEPTAAKENKNKQPPYYLTLRMPGQDKSAFSLTSAFIPDSAAGSEASVLTGFMAVDADAGSEAGKRADGYGTIRVIQLPRNTTVSGPGQVQNDFNSDPSASRELNILQQGGSSVRNGNLLTLPVGGGLLYVQPVYVKSRGETSIPLLRKVLVLFGNKVGFADTLDESLDQVFGGDSGANAGDAGTESETPGDDKPGDGSGDTPGEGEPGKQGPDSPSPGLKAALEDAKKALEEGQEALKNNDFAGYGEAQKKLQKALERALEAEQEEGSKDSGASDGDASTSTPTESPSASPTD